ncbi:hypothetical protein EPUL_000808 [Erysiphe pulchra]|uniref:Uncharacterized protein n=1 Tax=Erysiphe pulchra TaxID=225359 RepID=A0A2S4PVE4_9PEZI|nr:hypothetical protein EPUL_000808 [Erysiphe pulchra]
MSNFSRSHGSINEKLEHVLVPVTLDSISDAIASAVGANLVSISPSMDNAEFPDSPSTTWIVRLPEAHNRLPRVPFLSNIAHHLDCSSDLLLSIIVSCKARKALPSNLMLETLDTALFHCLRSISVNSISSLPTFPAANDLDKLAGEIIKAVHSLARQEYKSANKSPISSYELDEAKKAYRKVIRKAKNEFFQAKIEKARTSKEIFPLTKWHKSTASDIPMDALTVPKFLLDFPQISLHETREAILRVSNTALVADEIPTAILKHAWPLIEVNVCTLLIECLTLGYHSSHFLA